MFVSLHNFTMVPSFDNKVTKKSQYLCNVFIGGLNSRAWIMSGFFHSYQDGSLPLATDWKSKNIVARAELGAEQVKCSQRLQNTSQKIASQDMDRELEPH